MMVQLDDSATNIPDSVQTSTPDAAGFLLARFRIVYTLRALNDLSPNTYHFFEKYSSSYAREIRHWYGADKEILTGTGREFDVLAGAKKGEIRTIITGADYVYQLPLAAGRNPHRELITLGPKEEFFQYDNEEDMICKATIIVSSVDIPLRAGSNAARRLKQDRTVDYDEALLSPTNPSEGMYRSVSYHWTNVLPKEIVGVYVTW